jgi:hypothetical protein
MSEARSASLADGTRVEVASRIHMSDELQTRISNAVPQPLEDVFRSVRWIIEGVIYVKVWHERLL